MQRTVPGIIRPPGLCIPALHLRVRGPLVEGFLTNWKNVGEKHGETRFRIRAFYPEHGYVKRVLDPLFKHWIDDPEDAWEFWQRINSERRPSWFPGLDDYPGTLYAVDSVSFITTTGTGQTWTKPADFGPVNHVEGIGAGAPLSGGGGAYARANNITVGATESFDIPAGADLSNPGDTQFKDGSTLVADSGTNSGGAGGSTANSVGDVKYAGGTANQTFGGYAGGGGAAGPLGAGGAGGTCTNVTSSGAGGGGGGGNGGGSAGSASTGTTGGDGGNNNGGTGHGVHGASPTAGTNGGGGGGANGTNIAGANGGNGTEWDATHGSGGGSGMGSRNAPPDATAAGGNAGLYGGGAAYFYPALSGKGLIVVTYTPYVSTGMFFHF